jgi:YHS domain-containing protein
LGAKLQISEQKSKYKEKKYYLCSMTVERFINHVSSVLKKFGGFDFISYLCGGN